MFFQIPQDINPSVQTHWLTNLLRSKVHQNTNGRTNVMKAMHPNMEDSTLGMQLMIAVL